MPSEDATVEPSLPPRGLRAWVLVVAALAFVPALGVGFLGDDFVYIARFQTMPWAEWPRFFVHEWSGGIWGQPLKELRPFAALSFMIDARLWGGEVLGYRLVNLALHLAATALVVRLAWLHGTRLPGARAGHWAAGVAGLAFALHPAHVETVVWITGRADLLGSVAALGFLLAAETHGTRGGWGSAWLAWAALGLGVFTKEFCLIVPGLALAGWMLLGRGAGRAEWGRRARVLLGAMVVIALYAVARHAAFGRDTGNGFFGWNDGPAWNRQAAYLGWIMPVLPFTSAPEWAALPPMGAMRVAWLAGAVLLAAALGVAVVRRSGWVAPLFFGGAWWLATTVGLFVVVYFSPRHLYLPSAGVVIGAGLAIAAGRGWLRPALAAGLLVWCAAAHGAALGPWREAGRISREVLASLDADLAAADDEAIVLVAVPETHRHVLLWAWSSPQALGRPFLARPRRADQVIERPVNYVRSDRWVDDHRPVETVRRASAAAAVHVDREGRVSHRLVPRDELVRRADELAALVATGLNPDNLTQWIRTCAQR
jgi:hypothetical protein